LRYDRWLESGTRGDPRLAESRDRSPKSSCPLGFALGELPESFQRDLHAWLDRISGDDLMSDGPMRPVRPITRQSHAAQIRRFASAVVLTGVDPKMITSLADVTTIDAFTKGLTFLLRQRANKSAGVINVAGTLKAIARHHVGVEQHHLEQMAKIIRRIGPRQHGLTPKNRARLRPLDDPRNVRALLNLPTKLMDLASRERRLYKAALLAQTSVAIEILEMTLMRMRNLVGLDIEKHLHRARRNGPLHIVIEGDESKNHAAQEYPLPPQSVELIDRYLAEYRPILADPGNSALFPGKKGGAKHANTLAEQIKSAVWTHVGLRWNPHLFRHAEAKLYLDQNPGGYGVPQRVLGHRSDTTTTKFYAGQETEAAVRHFDQTILKLRAKPALPSPRPTLLTLGAAYPLPNGLGVTAICGMRRCCQVICSRTVDRAPATRQVQTRRS
jgi:hypothetical protein